MPLVLWCFAEQIERKRGADLGTLRTVRGGGPIRLALPVANTQTGAPTGRTFLVYSRFSFRSHAERGYLCSNRFLLLLREPERVCRSSGRRAISLTAETAQIFIVTRDSRASDIFANTAGAGMGAALAGVVAGLAGRSVWLPSPHSALVSLWAVFQLYPFQHVGRFARFVENSFSSPSATSGFSSGADWLAAYAAAIHWLHRRPRIAVGCTAALLPLRVALTGRRPDATEFAGWAAATLLCGLFAPHVSAHPRPAGLALAVAVLFRELAPYGLSSTGLPFQWVPFQSLLLSDRLFAIFLVLQKSFVYGALVWLWGGNRITAVSTALIATGILVLEFLQRYLPGRTPDITDAVLVLALAALLRLCERDARVECP